MTFWVIVGDIACLIIGGAIVWVGKEKMQSIWTDANTIAANLRARADAIAKAVERK